MAKVIQGGVTIEFNVKEVAIIERALRYAINRNTEFTDADDKIADDILVALNGQ